MPEIYNEEEVTKDTWNSYAENRMDGGFGYLEANGEYVGALEKMLTPAQSFDELKDNLTNFIADRKELSHSVTPTDRKIMRLRANGVSIF